MTHLLEILNEMISHSPSVLLMEKAHDTADGVLAVIKDLYDDKRYILTLTPERRKEAV